MTFTPIASSSKGNAYLLTAESGETLLVDDGLSYRELVKRLGGEAVLERLVGVLVTHNHTDHVHGLPGLLKHHDVPVFANLMTAEATAAQEKLDESAFTCFENGQEFEAGPFTVRAFAIPHDTSDPVGYLVKADGMTYFHGTDIGKGMMSIGLKLAEADEATLESNHDMVMLTTSGRAPSLIQRIRGGRGHLSNDEAAELVKKYASPKLKRLNLAHLSQDCNAPHLAERTMRAALAAIGRNDVELEILNP